MYVNINKNYKSYVRDGLKFSIIFVTVTFIVGDDDGGGIYSVNSIIRAGATPHPHQIINKHYRGTMHYTLIWVKLKLDTATSNISDSVWFNSVSTVNELATEVFCLQNT